MASASGAGSIDANAVGPNFPVPSVMCILKPTKEMVAEEEKLSTLAVVGVVTHGRDSNISVSDVCYAVMREFNLDLNLFKVKMFYPDDFIIRFKKAEHRETVARAGLLKDPCFLMELKPWSRKLYSRPVGMDVKVEIELKGIPAHAWQAATVEKLLSPFCSIETMYLPTRVQPRFLVEAWAASVAAVPPSTWLGIPEPVWSDRLADVMIDIGGTPNKVSTYQVELVTVEMGPEPDYGSDHTMDSGYGYDPDRSPKGYGSD